MFVAFGDNDTLMTEASGRVVSFSGTAPSVQSSWPRVKVVLAAYVLLRIVGFFVTKRVDVATMAEVPVDNEEYMLDKILFLEEKILSLLQSTPFLTDSVGTLSSCPQKRDSVITGVYSVKHL